MSETSPTYQIVPAEDEAAVEHVYEHMKNLWFERHNMEVPDDVLEEILDGYRKGDFETHRAPQAKFLREFCRERGAAGRMSFIDLGCANGTTLHYFTTFMSASAVDYLGVEPYKPFRDDFEAHFPDHHIIDGDVESFPELDVTPYLETPVTAVMAFLVLCMTPMRVARAFFHKAAEITDDIIGVDYCIDFDGNLPDTNPWLYWYNEAAGQLYFLHPFQKYLDEIGFEAVERRPQVHADGKIGWEVFHFRRKR